MFAVVGPVLAAPPEDGGFSSTLSYSSGLYHLVEYSLGVAGFALAAGFVYSLMTKNEVGSKYRTAVHASALIQGVAAVAYLALFLSWQASFVYSSGQYVPTPDTRFQAGLRYADWSVTVPLLTVELLAVCAMAGAAMRRARFLSMSAAFLMIITGFLGAFVFYDGTSTLWLNIWGWISTVFFIALYVVLGGAVFKSRSSMSAESFASLRNAAIVLLSVFGVYPLLYVVQTYVSPATSSQTLVVWAVVIQVGFSFADVLAKVGFGSLIHKVGKLRTAEDVNSREESHPEQIWISHVKEADAWPPQVAALAGVGALSGDGANGANGANGADGARGAHSGATPSDPNSTRGF